MRYIALFKDGKTVKYDCWHIGEDVKWNWPKRKNLSRIYNWRYE